ncbi:MAG: GIY-YIG nuclease family protein [Methanomassiliicoccales archaeon]|nr:GIY-YIG nuclease family protein [Methanomassiliicoccales archaeon]
MRSTPGNYVLILHLPKERSLKVGKLGEIELPPGHYLYCGSAQSGLGPRLARHMRADKALHWHVDHLTSVAEPLGALLFTGGKEGECQLSQTLAASSLVEAAVPGFGCSDCHCLTHLYRVRDEAPLSVVLDMLRSLGR